jgi:hypothetical protein
LGKTLNLVAPIILTLGSLPPPQKKIKVRREKGVNYSASGNSSIKKYFKNNVNKKKTLYFFSVFAIRELTKKTRRGGLWDENKRERWICRFCHARNMEENTDKVRNS